MTPQGTRDLASFRSLDRRGRAGALTGDKKGFGYATKVCDGGPIDGRRLMRAHRRSVEINADRQLT